MIHYSLVAAPDPQYTFRIDFLYCCNEQSMDSDDRKELHSPSKRLARAFSHAPIILDGVSEIA